jgi:hypothetical protein
MRVKGLEYIIFDAHHSVGCSSLDPFLLFIYWFKVGTEIPNNFVVWIDSNSDDKIAWDLDPKVDGRPTQKSVQELESGQPK